MPNELPASTPTPKPHWQLQVRLALGLLQGWALYFLITSASKHSWPASSPAVFGPLFLVTAILPVLVISALGHLRSAALWRWALLCGLILALLASYDIWRHSDILAQTVATANHLTRTQYPSPLLIFIASVGFFIAQALRLASADDGNPIASYNSYFERGWGLLVQITFSAFFVAALWLVLWLGAGLLKLIGIQLLVQLLVEPWFFIPVTVTAFSAAIHLTDVRPAIVRGIRTLLLVLLSWILPLATLLIGIFLLKLPFTGFGPLWQTKYVSAILLGACAVLIILINATYQNGQTSAAVAKVLRKVARLACLLPLPLALLGTFALALRVQTYGWSAPRVIAACAMFLALCYGTGYAGAALWRARPTDNAVWLPGIAQVNIWNAFVVLGLLLALFSPLLDPARIGVTSQMARLDAGLIEAKLFDFTWLRFHGARFGQAALQQLSQRNQGKDAPHIRAQALAALQKTGYGPSPETATPQLPFNLQANWRANLQVWPTTASLPADFIQTEWKAGQELTLPDCMHQAGKQCDAYLIDFDDDGKPEVLVIGRASREGAGIFRQEAQKWQQIASFPYDDLAGCASLREKLQAGQFSLRPPRDREIEINGQRINLHQTRMGVLRCPKLSP